MLGFNFQVSQTGARFMASRATTRILLGPIGSGKSSMALMELIRLAYCQNKNPRDGVRRSRFGILRNTVAQLRDTVKPLLDKWLVQDTGGMLAQWRHTENKLVMRGFHPDGGVVDAEFWLLAADTPDDVRRLLSLELTAAWVEEAREVDSEVFFGLQSRCKRYPARVDGGCAFPCVICSTNAPDVDTFWHEVCVEPPEGWEVFTQPPAVLEDGSINPLADNLQFLDPNYYPDLIAGRSKDWVDVYLKNKFGRGKAGSPVYDGSFSFARHATTGLQFINSPSYPVVVGVDNGLTAAAAITQLLPTGQVMLGAEAVVPEGQTMSFERFFDNILVPKLKTRCPTGNVVMVLDPACFQRSQLDARTIAQFILSRGYEVKRSPLGSNHLEPRVAAVEKLLTRQYGDMPGLVVDKDECPTILGGFEYGYRYPMRRTGESNIEAGPEKNHYSHVHDAVQYAALHHTHGDGFSDSTRRAYTPKHVSRRAWT